MNLVHYTIRVQGSVQGVFFRASAQAKARELGVKGIVRNERDGGVYLEAEGTREAVNEFIDWCSQGPPHAVVSAVDVQEGVMKNYVAFDIIRS